MLSRSLWQWDINITIIIQDIIHVSETGFCPRLQVEPTQMGPVERVSVWLQTSATTPIGLIKPISVVDKKLVIIQI
jgi:hypothetical protein